MAVHKGANCLCGYARIYLKWSLQSYILRFSSSLLIIMLVSSFHSQFTLLICWIYVFQNLGFVNRQGPLYYSCPKLFYIFVTLLDIYALFPRWGCQPQAKFPTWTTFRLIVPFACIASVTLPKVWASASTALQATGECKLLFQVRLSAKGRHEVPCMSNYLHFPEF